MTSTDIAGQESGQKQFSMDECIERCLACYRACEQAGASTLEFGDELELPVRLLIDCADICRVSASFMLRGSDFHAETCGVCADVCEACAAACANIDDELIRTCADACAECVESCRFMAGRHHHGA